MRSFFSGIRTQRFLAVTLFLVLFFQAIFTFYRFISTPTDENWFRNAPSRFMVVKSIHAETLSKKKFTGSQPQFAATSFDSIMVGDLILAVNNGSLKTMKDVYEALEDGPQDDIRFEILRPSLNYILTFRTQRSSLPPEFLVLLPNYVYVTDVIPRGASERAGMKTGDLILRINEQEFTNANEADQILRLGQIGKSLKYEILRNNQFVQLNVTLAQFGIPIALLLFTLSGVLWMIAGTFIVVSRPQFTGARLLGYGFLFMGFFLAILVVRRDFFNTPEVVIRNMMLLFSYIFGTAFFFHSHHYFPLERPELIGKKWIARGYYIASCLSVAGSLLFNTPIALGFIMVYGLAIVVLYRRRASLEYLRLNTVIRWTAGIVGVLTAAAMLIFADSVQGTFVGIAGVLLIFIPMSYLYTIGRYRLLDINFRVRRNTQYSIVTAVWGIGVFYLLVWGFFQLPLIDLPQANIVFTGTAIEINDDPELAAQRVSSERVMLMALAIGLTFVMMKLRRSGQKLIDKKYYRQQYDYRRASYELGEVLGATLTMEDLARGLVQKLSELMKLKRVGVLFFRDEQCCSCLSAHGFDGNAWEQFCVQHEQELIHAVRTFQNEFRVDYLPAGLKEEFHREGFYYGIPIRSKDRLIGVLLVGEKQSETMFQQEDLGFLASTAKQASVAIENAFLYEELAEKERMKHELQIARRIQLDSLPQTTPNVRGLDISGTSVPAMEVGGDFFDYLSNGNGKLTVVIGDVSGKGTSAALYMSKVQGILRSLHGFDLPPKDLLTRANKLLCQDLEKRSFVTVLGAEFHTETKTITVSRAGHLPLWHYHAATASVNRVLPRGLGLGLNETSIFTAEMEQKELSYAAGDIFLFATDGVTEAHNAGGDFGEERLTAILRNGSNTTAKEIQTALLSELSQFVGTNDQHDDQTVVVVKAL